jgi:protein involved in ribonucleotide reduction
MLCNHAILRNTAFCAILIFGFASTTENRTKQVFDQVDAYLNKQAQAQFLRGTVLVGIDGKIELEKSYGNADDVRRHLLKGPLCLFFAPGR